MRLLFPQGRSRKEFVPQLENHRSKKKFHNTYHKYNIAYYPLDTETGSVTLRLTGSAGGWDDRVDMTQNVSITKGKISRLTVSYDENSGDVDIEFETDTDMDESSNDVTVQ